MDAVTAPVVNGRNASESYAIDADLDVTINASGGDDVINVNAPNATINAGDGNDTVHTGDTGSYFTQLGAGANTCYGGDGADYVVLASGATDAIFLGGGNDTLNAHDDLLDDDTIDGGHGYDTLLIYINRTNVQNIEQIVLGD